MISPGDSSDLEYELKFLLPPQRVPAALACLDALCRPDPIHPENVVASLYYDTRRLDSYHEKAASDLFKTKVRLRWYEEPKTGRRFHGAFLEVKHRIGLRRRKLRVETGSGATELADLPFDHPRLCSLPGLLRSRDRSVPGGLRPLLVVSYLRRRYVDPASASRISLDIGISVPRADSGVFPHRPTRALEAAVLEVKNRRGELPPGLHSLIRVGSRLASFSKYAACVSAASSNSLYRA